MGRIRNSVELRREVSDLLGILESYSRILVTVWVRRRLEVVA